MINLTSYLGKDRRRIIQASSFDPTPYIHLVNELMPLGKDAILTELRKYRGDHDVEGTPLDGVDFLLKILFSPPSGRIFQPQASVLWLLPSPVNIRSMPSFPLLVVDDIPIYGVLGTYAPNDGIYAGHDKRDFMEDVRKWGVLRTNPLTPPSQPLETFRKILISDQWYWSKNCIKESRGQNDKHYEDYPDGPKQDVMRQLLRLVRHVYPPANRYIVPVKYDYKLITDSDWERCREDVAKLRLSWDMQKGQYQTQR